MSSRWYMWNWKLWFSVALATWIGTVTRPNEMAPFQMVRGMSDLRVNPEQDQPTSTATAPHTRGRPERHAVPWPPRSPSWSIRPQGAVAVTFVWTTGADGVLGIVDFLRLAGLNDVDDVWCGGLL